MTNSQKEILTAVGKLIANLQSLEFIMRIFLCEITSNSSSTCKLDFFNYNVGDIVDENPFTNYDSLNKVIKKVNNTLSEKGYAEQIDSSIVQIRDAFAHGSVLSNSPEGPFKLFKFSKPVKCKVKIEISFEVSMTCFWALTSHRTKIK